MAAPWRKRSWNDPATLVALVALVAGLVMIFLDKLDTVAFGADIDFGQWPYILVGIPTFWFLGLKLGIGGLIDDSTKGDKADG